MEWTCTRAEAVEDRAFCARRFGTDYCIFGPTEEACRDMMVHVLGRSWKWLRLLGWRVRSFTTPRTIWHLEWKGD